MALVVSFYNINGKEVGLLLKYASCSSLLAVTGIVLMLLSGIFYRQYRLFDMAEKERLAATPDML